MKFPLNKCHTSGPKFLLTGMRHFPHAIVTWSCLKNVRCIFVFFLWVCFQDYLRFVLSIISHMGNEYKEKEKKIAYLLYFIFSDGMTSGIGLANVIE